MALRYRCSLLPLGICALLFVAQPAQASFFDVFLEGWLSAPAYPTVTPVRCQVLDDVGGVLTPLHTTSMGLTDAGALGGPQYSTLCTGSDGSPTPSYIGPSSFFDVFLESVTPPPGQPGARVSSFFDIFTEISLCSSGAPGQFVPLNTGYPPADERRWFRAGWVRSFQVCWIEIGVGVPEVPQGAMLYRFEIAVTPAAEAAGAQLAALPVPHSPYWVDSFFDVWCELSVPGSLPAGMQVLSVTTTSMLLTAPTPARNQTWGALKGLYR